MNPLLIVPTDEIPRVTRAGSGDEVALINTADIRTLLDHIDASLEAASRIENRATADAIKELALGVRAAADVLLGVTRGVYLGRIAETGYPEAL